MITIEKTFPGTITYPLERLGDPEKLVFFDIETTGFSADYNTVYLIGCIWPEGDQLRFIQWFADTKTAEADVLNAFFEFLKNFRTLVHFNGDMFDIPFVTKRAGTLKLTPTFDCVESIDIFRRIKPFKKLLGLPDMKQKTIERFLKISREDLYNGGELIEVYKEYVRHPAKDSLALLKQHNYEDVLYMPKLLPVLSYPKLWEQAFSLQSLQASEYRSMDGASGNKELFFTLALQYPVPKPVSFSYDDCYLSMSGSTARLRVRLFEGELRFFYDGSPKDYYYLPAEDIAVHKSIASAVDKEHRVQANASNCYGKKYAIFLPQYDAMFSPVFREQPRGRKCYFELSADFAADPAMQMDYVLHLLETMRSHRK